MMRRREGASPETRESVSDVAPSPLRVIASSPSIPLLRETGKRSPYPLDRLLSPARDRFQSAAFEQRLQFVQALDAKVSIQELGSLQPDTRESSQVEDGHRYVLAQLVKVGRSAGRDDLHDLRAYSLADARNLLQLGGAAAF